MKLSAILAGVFFAVLTSQLCADPGTFTQAELTAMGLSSVKVISDHEASTVRVYGSYPSRWGNAYPFVRGVNRLEDRSIRNPRPIYPLRTAALWRMQYSRRR